jgi:DNA-binding Lrp family transcriptional regulator
MRPLDRTDSEILAALQKNARLSNKELAAKVGLAQSTCLERVRRLLRDGILRGFHAEVSPKALGIGLMAMVAVRLSHHSREMVEAFRTHALAQEEVIGFFYMAGSNDFLLQVAVRDADHLRDLNLSAFTTRSEVAHLETALVFEHVGNRPLPNYAEEEE